MLGCLFFWIVGSSDPSEAVSGASDLVYTSQNPPGRSTIVSVALSLLDDETTDRNDTMSVHQWLMRLGEHPTPYTGCHASMCSHINMMCLTFFTRACATHRMATGMPQYAASMQADGVTTVAELRKARSDLSKFGIKVRGCVPA